MRTGTVPAAPHLIKTFGSLVDPIQKLGTKLSALANLNRTVHLPTYNKLITEAAQRYRQEIRSTP